MSLHLGLARRFLHTQSHCGEIIARGREREGTITQTGPPDVRSTDGHACLVAQAELRLRGAMAPLCMSCATHPVWGSPPRSWTPTALRVSGAAKLGRGVQLLRAIIKESNTSAGGADCDRFFVARPTQITSDKQKARGPHPSERCVCHAALVSPLPRLRAAPRL